MPDDKVRDPWLHEGVGFWSTDYIAAPRTRVFDHLTQGTLTRKYYFGMAIHDPSGTGEPVYFGSDETTSPIHGSVTVFDPPERFEHTFAFTGRDEPATTVRFTLREVGPNLTQLETVHHGFESRASETFNDICGGWPAILSSLKTLLETGEPIAWPEEGGT